MRLVSHTSLQAGHDTQCWANVGPTSTLARHWVNVPCTVCMVGAVRQFFGRLLTPLPPFVTLFNVTTLRNASLNPPPPSRCYVIVEHGMHARGKPPIDKAGVPSVKMRFVNHP